MVAGGRELIDTLWNVNISFICLSGIRDLRINRYIMECKYSWEPDGNSNKRELIDTLWNVNVTSGGNVTIDGQELIDTLWNVNEKI